LERSVELFELGVQVRALGRQKYWLNAFSFQDLLESRRELAVAVHQHIAFALEEAVLYNLGRWLCWARSTSSGRNAR
jgi:hypothetical protein